VDNKVKLSQLKYDPLQFLLSSRQPAWVKYQTISGILHKPKGDAELKTFKAKRDNSAIVAHIRAKQHQDGSFPCLPWMHIHKYYFHQLLEMGYDLKDRTVTKASQNLLNYQLPDGGYMHPCGRYVNKPDPSVGWAACVSGYVTYALITLGFQNDARVMSSIDGMAKNQRDNGGWICRTIGDHSPYCIKSGTPWVFLCLVSSGRIEMNDQITKKTLKLFERHKQKIIRHGYLRDRFYRCDETLILQSLNFMGVSKDYKLKKYFIGYLLKKQQPDGSWHFKGKPSAWYTLEVLRVLKNI
jgi:hypothetical protein